MRESLIAPGNRESGGQRMAYCFAAHSGEVIYVEQLRVAGGYFV